MEITSVTVGLPVSDLTTAVVWYQRVFDLSAAPVSPVPGLAELALGPVELQLSEEPTVRSGAAATVRVGVASAAAEHLRLTGLGEAIGPLEHVEGAVDYFDFADPDGNLLSVYSLLE